MEARANLYCYKKWEVWDYNTYPEFLADKQWDRMVVNMSTMNLLKLLMKDYQTIQEILKSKREIKKCLIGKWLNDIT